MSAGAQLASAINWPQFGADSAGSVVSLLNEAREKTDEIIDELHAPLVGKEPRPRTYRVKARRRFVAFTKKKKPSRRAIRQAKKQQLGFLRRSLKVIDRLLENPEAQRPTARL